MCCPYCVYCVYCVCSTVCAVLSYLDFRQPVDFLTGTTTLSSADGGNGRSLLGVSALRVGDVVDCVRRIHTLSHANLRNSYRLGNLRQTGPQIRILGAQIATGRVKMWHTKRCTADLSHLAADPHLARRIVQFSETFPGKSPQFVQARQFAPDWAPNSHFGRPNRDRALQDVLDLVGTQKGVQPI